MLSLLTELTLVLHFLQAYDPIQVRREYIVPCSIHSKLFSYLTPTILLQPWDLGKMKYGRK